MDWQVVFYQDKHGNEPVKAFVLSQDDGTIAEILHVFKLLRDLNVELRMPYVRKINKSGIRELRIKHGSDIYRVFFFACTGRKFVLLHAILKKSDKIPAGDIAIAIERMNDHISRH
jgi:phage-related protein